ncbi:MAG: glycosyltransferase [Gemmatimonadetes bacterium]|nr:glycosyltransferase [Gemmatimonadota bacterium]
MSKRILIVSYYFPPLGGVGVFRALKLARHLPDLGWDTHVLTLEPPQYYCIDHTLLDQIPSGVKVHRSESLDPFRLYRRIKGGELASVEDATASDPLFGALTRFAKSVNTWLFVPDNKVGWRGPAAKLGTRVVRENAIDLVYTINVPQTSHLIGRDIQKRTGASWVADFRDAWTANPDLVPPTPFHKARQTALERDVLERADAVTAVNDTIRDLLADALGHDRAKFLTVHNGFDPDDFGTNDGAVKRDSRFTMVFVGTFHKRTDPRLLLRPYAEAIRSGRIEPGKSRIVVVGAQSARTREAVHELGLGDHVDFTGFHAHRASVRWMESADLLLQVIAEGPGAEQIVSGKLYEYLAAGRPVLTIGPAGEARTLVDRLRVGAHASVGDPAAIESALVSLADAHRAGGIPYVPDTAAIAALSFPEQTALLSSHFDRILAEKR